MYAWSVSPLSLRKVHEVKVCIEFCVKLFCKPHFVTSRLNFLSCVAKGTSREYQSGLLDFSLHFGCYDEHQFALLVEDILHHKHMK